MARRGIAVWAVLFWGHVTSGQIAIPGLNCTSLPLGESGCRGALRGDEQMYWAFHGSAHDSWMQVDFGDMYLVTSVTFKQLYNKEDKNFVTLRLDFSGGTSQSVTFQDFTDGFVEERFNLTQVPASSVNMTVTSSVGNQFGTTYNGFIQVQYFGFPTDADTMQVTGNDMSTSVEEVTTPPAPTSNTPAPTTAANTAAETTPTPQPPVSTTTPPPTPTPTPTISTTAQPPPTPAPPTPAPTTPAPPSTTPPTPALPTPAPPTPATPTTAPLTPAPRTLTPSTAAVPTTDIPNTTAAPEGPGSQKTVLYAIAGVIVVLVVALVIALAVFFVRKRRAKDKEAEADIVLGEMGPANGIMNTGFDENPRKSGGVVSHPVPVGSLVDHISNLSRSSSGFKDEFVAISIGPRYPVTASSLSENLDKNRFVNILAYDHTRVPLHSDTTDTDYVNVKEIKGDYINANFINGYKKEKEFIACQGPLNTTVIEFWRMVWQNNSSKIVMVTNLVEKGRSKCAYYWPHEGSEQYGNIRVRLEKEDAFPEYIVRILELSKGKEKKTVLQYHFIAWPDEGAPTTGTSLLALQDLINSEPSNGSEGPIIIHCSAGIGRTGTFIAVDYLRKQAAEEGVVDVMGCVDLMRQFRINMVQSLEQYAYIYTTVLEALYCGRVRWPINEFPSEYSTLVESSFEGEETPADKHFKVLEAFKPTTYNGRIKSALDAANMPKNRLSTLLPAENVQPFLQPFSGAPSNYVNAVMVDSYKARDVAAVTQMPLPHTQIDLWRLAADFKCNAILMLNEFSSDSEDAPSYLPISAEEHLSLGPFVISTRNVIEGSDVVVTELGFRASHKFKEEQTLHHIRITSWPDDQRLPNSPSLLIDLYRNLAELKSRSGDGKTIIHCLYGADKSGLVCAALFLLEAIDSHAYVDVFNVVKRIRRSRPQFVPTTEQYKYLHTVAKTFVETKGSAKFDA